MQKIRILAYADSLMPEFNTGYLKFYKNIVSKLEKDYTIELIWVGTIGGIESGNFINGQYLYNIFSFSDGKDLLEKIKPDILILTDQQEYCQRSMLIMSKKLKIPSVVLLSHQPDLFQYSKIYSIKNRLSMLRGKTKEDWPTTRSIIWKKLTFLKNTINNDKSFLNTQIDLIKILYNSMTKVNSQFFSDFADLYLCNNEMWVAEGEKYHIIPSKIKIVGELTLDDTFVEISNTNSTPENVTRILLITSGDAEHRHVSFSEKNELIIKILSKIKKEFPKIELIIKIHPTSEELDNYREIILKTNNSVKIFQKENLIKLITDSKIVIGFGDTSALYNVILMKKPLIMIDFFKEKSFFVKEGVAKTCKIEQIDSVINSDKNLEMNSLENFIRKRFYKFDGRCSERAYVHIKNIIELKSKKT
jgi:hypothetical protein